MVPDRLAGRVGPCPLLKNSRKTDSASRVPGIVANRTTDPFALCLGHFDDAETLCGRVGLKFGGQIVEQRGQHFRIFVGEGEGPGAEWVMECVAGDGGFACRRDGSAGVGTVGAGGGALFFCSFGLLDFDVLFHGAGNSFPATMIWEGAKTGG